MGYRVIMCEWNMASWGGGGGGGGGGWRHAPSGNLTTNFR